MSTFIAPKFRSEYAKLQSELADVEAYLDSFKFDGSNEGCWEGATESRCEIGFRMEDIELESRQFLIFLVFGIETHQPVPAYDDIPF